MQGIVKRLLVMVGALMQMALAQTNSIPNPILWADVPDISIVRVDAKYYMVSTTMHMNPGAPIMESTDLVNWKIINYVHTTLASNDPINLTGGLNDYGHGSWAASIRYKSGTFYVLIPGKSSGFTHLYSTTDIHNGPWKEVKLPFWHDPSLHLEEDGKAYVVYGSGDIRIIELESDLTKVKSGGVDKVLIANATAVAGTGGLGSEGAHIEKINGYYYVFTISWPPGNMRTETVHRSQTLQGTYDGRIAFQDKGVAQGSVIQTSDGTWYGYLFQDAGAVGRCPWLVPLKWENDWPVFGTNGKAPTTLSMNASLPVDGFGIVASDDFSASKLKLEWQWNHNPVQTAWSLSSRAGFMRLTTTRTDTDFLQARNTLTQRAYGPKSSAQIALETSGMKDGDFAGLGGLQKQYGLVGVKVNGASKTVVMVNGAGASPVEVASVALSQNKIYLRVDMDFTSRTDKATFFYSLDGNSWTLIGNTVSMAYTIPHFMGYRFALFHYATKSAGGYADFDFFKIGKAYNSLIPIAAVIASSSSAQSSSSANVSSSSAQSSSSMSASSSSNVPLAVYKGEPSPLLLKKQPRFDLLGRFHSIFH